MPSSDDLIWMRAGNEGLFTGTCVRMVYTMALTRSGAEETTWPDGATYPCRFGSLSGSENPGQDLTKLRYGATLCLAHDAVFDYRDRVRLTHHLGEELAEPEEFEIVGHPERGPSGLLLQLRRITA